MEIIGKTNRSVLPKGKHQREKWVSKNDKKNVESLEIIEMTTITYQGDKLQ